VEEQIAPELIKSRIEECLIDIHDSILDAFYKGSRYLIKVPEKREHVLVLKVEVVKSDKHDVRLGMVMFDKKKDVFSFSVLEMDGTKVKSSLECRIMLKNEIRWSIIKQTVYKTAIYTINSENIKKSSDFYPITKLELSNLERVIELCKKINPEYFK